MCPQSINVSLTAFLLRPPTWCQGVYPVHTAHNMKQGSWWWFYMCGKFLLHLCVNSDESWVMIVGENGKTKHMLKILYHLIQSVRWSVTNTFRFPICWCLWTVTERMWTMRRDIFFESYDQDISTWPKNTRKHFSKLFLSKCTRLKRIF